MPSSDTVRSGQELVASSSTKKDACSTEDETSIATPGGDINERNTLINLPSWEEIAALLRKVPCVISLEPPMPGLDALFLLTHSHFVNLLGDPPITVMPRLPHDTLESVLRCIHSIQQYAAEETTKW